jgi:hypothetical protein
MKLGVNYCLEAIVFFVRETSKTKCLNWTFGIPTDGENNLQFHNTIIDSIIAQDIKNYEIVFCIEKDRVLPLRYHTSPCRVVYCDTEKKAWITRKKNLIAGESLYENICLMHDYIMLGTKWYRGYKSFCDWDVCMNPVLFGKKRFYDWASYDHPRYGRSGLIPYHRQDLKNNMYISGGYFCVKKDFLLQNPFNEGLCWGQEEDVEWSKRIRRIWNLKFNILSPVYCLKKKP